MRRNKKKYKIYSTIEDYKLSVATNKPNDFKVLYPENGYYPYIIKIEHPVKATLEFFDKLLYHYDYHIGKVEFSFDFYTKDPDSIYSFLKSNLFMKWRGKSLDLKFDTTTYYNDNRGAIGKC